MDDIIHYDTDLQTNWSTIDFLIRVGQAGIVLNAEKLYFVRRIVDFAAFRISDETIIEPMPKYMDAIRDFPTPTSTTDIRSWFGHVNQVANYAQLRDIMAPFIPFPRPKCRFEWTPWFRNVRPNETNQHTPRLVSSRHRAGTSCHRNIVRVTRVYLTVVPMVGES